MNQRETSNIKNNRLKFCHFYKGVEPTMDNGFDEYYYAKAEQFYVEGAGSLEDKDAIHAVHSLKLEDLSAEMPIELVGYLYFVCDHISQRSSWKGVSPEEVAEYFRTKYFPQYIKSCSR